VPRRLHWLAVAGRCRRAVLGGGYLKVRQCHALTSLGGLSALTRLLGKVIQPYFLEDAMNTILADREYKATRARLRTSIKPAEPDV
jgi:hypothetical protein